MFSKPSGKPDFFSFEQEILKYWKESNILEKSINQRPDDKNKTFYDGPITANGDPHIGHALTFSLKDIIPRYWTMQGFRVTQEVSAGIAKDYLLSMKLKKT